MLNIDSFRIKNRVKNDELIEISYQFYYKRDKREEIYTITEVFDNGKITLSESKTEQNIQVEDVKSFKDKIVQYKNLNDLFSFYQNYKDDIFSLGLNFEEKITADQLLLFSTIDDDYEVKIDFKNMFVIPACSLTINKKTYIGEPNISMSIYVKVSDFTMKNILNSKNKVKYLLNPEIPKFIENAIEKDKSHNKMLEDLKKKFTEEVLKNIY